MKNISLKNISLFIVSLLFGFGISAQSIKDANAEVRNVKNYHAIKVSTGIELILVQGSEEAVAVSANTIEHRENIRTVVEDGVLKIYYDNKVWKNQNNRRLKAYVSAIKLDGIDISSGATVKTQGAFKADKMDLEVSSGATFKGELNAERLEVDQSSGSVVDISGTAGSMKIEGSSGSVFNGYGLVVETSEADISSGGSINITVNKELSAEATSGGSISYKGNGVIRNLKTGSGGSVSRKS
jgi:hypothetical protein